VISRVSDLSTTGAIEFEGACDATWE